MTTEDTAIHKRALLVSLNLSGWSARKYDRKITEKVNADMHASTDAGRYNKHLLPGDAAEYKTMVTIAGSIRAAHYAHTLAWSDEGWRLLPVAEYNVYTEWFREQKRAFDTALDNFIDAYPTLRDQARNMLNGLYRDEDYPSPQDMRKRFGLIVNFAPLPARGDIRVNLASDQVADIEASIASRIDSAVKLATTDAWTRLHDVVAHIAERLADPKAIFRDSLIENAVEVCDTLRRLNVTNDPNLDAMRTRVLDQLTRYAPDTLRDVPHVRADVAAKADDIMRAMAGLYDAS